MMSPVSAGVKIILDPAFVSHRSQRARSIEKPKSLGPFDATDDLGTEAV